MGELIVGACAAFSAGCHDDATRPTTLHSRSSASRPRIPPTSTSSVCAWGELAHQLAPERAHHRAVGLGDRVAGRDLVAHQHDAPDLRQVLHARLSEHPVHAGQLTRSDPREQVVERRHRVRLAAAEVGLELHHRVAALAGDALHGAHEQALQALGHRTECQSPLSARRPPGRTCKTGRPQRRWRRSRLSTLTKL